MGTLAEETESAQIGQGAGHDADELAVAAGILGRLRELRMDDVGQRNQLQHAPTNMLVPQRPHIVGQRPVPTLGRMFWLW